MADANKYPFSGAVSLILKGAGGELDCAKYLVSVSTMTEFNRVSSAELVFDDGGMFDETFKAISSEMIAPGQEIEVLAGYETDSDTIFKGIVVSQKLVLENTSTELHVQLKHPAYKMALGRRLRSFEDVSDVDVIKTICSDYGISVSTDTPGCTHEKLVQYNCSDWDFMNLRAEASGLFPYTSLKGIEACAVDVSSEPVLEIDNAHTINRIQIEINGRDSVGSIETQAWNYSSQETETASVKGNASETGQGDLKSGDLSEAVGSPSLTATSLNGQINNDEFEAWTSADVARRNLSRIVGKMTIPGFADIWPGDCVSLANLGGRFNGNAPVSSVIHELTTTSWETTLGIGMQYIPYCDRFPDIDSKAAGGLYASAKGLQYAKVEAIEGDPAGEERIYVKLIGNADTHLWARISTIDAGDGRGCVFNPEIGDEVVVGFVNGNPGQAVILGSLHSSGAAAPHPKSDDNNLKGFVTREGLKFTFDDENKAFILETPGGNSLSISDSDKGISMTDQNGNTLVMNDQGVSIESKNALSIKASGDLTLEGTNVTVKANSQFKAQGNASAEVSSSGNTVVKGSLVQIN